MTAPSGRVYVDFNPRDESPYVLGLVVAAPTGVVYANQCGGLECLWKEMEGYLVVLGGASAAEPFISFFAARFSGRPPTAGGAGWLKHDLDSLEDLIRNHVHYFEMSPAEGSETKIELRLDVARLKDLTEAWIPVRVGGASGVLLFANSD